MMGAARPGGDQPSRERQPRPASLALLLADEEPAGAAALAVTLRNHCREPRALSRGELWQGALCQARRLSRAGVEAGDRVMIMLPTSIEFIEAFFGALLTGAVPVPVAPPATLRGPELEAHLGLLRHIAADCRAVACLSRERVRQAVQEHLAAADPRLRCLDGAGGSRALALAEIARPRPDEPAMIQYTSGSTQRPKGVVLSYGNLLANLEAIARLLGAAGTVGVSWLPLYHDMGLIACLLTALYSRSPLVLMPPQAFVRDPARWLRAISEHRATHTMAPNFAFSYCVKSLTLEALADVRLDSLEMVANGAEPIDLEMARRFERKFEPLGLRRGVICPVYGLAEATVGVTASVPGGRRVDRVDADRLERSGEALPAAPGRRCRTLIGNGRPLDGVEVEIFDARDRPLPERRVGEIVVRGPSVMRGYHGAPEETAAALRGGWLHTGDLGYLADGELYISGRSKEILIRHGRNYCPQEIEMQVGRVGGVEFGSAVFALEGVDETVVIVVAETRERDPAQLAEMALSIRRRMQQAFLFGPDDLRLVRPGTIPRTTSGKVRRAACRRLYESGALDRRSKPYGPLPGWSVPPRAEPRVEARGARQ